MAFTDELEKQIIIKKTVEVGKKSQSHDVAMVPEILSATYRIFCHYGPFFALLPQKNPTTQKIKILKKLKKTPGDIIILHERTKNLDQISDLIVYFHLGLFFTLLPP